MDVFTIGATLWRHKRVSIPLLMLTLLGVFYVIALRPATYQAKADVLLTSPPVPPTAMQIAQDPALAKVNNPLANLGNLTYVADTLIDVVTAPAAKQTLTQAGASGYQVGLDDATQTYIPPAINISGTGSNAQTAIQTTQLVATAISRDLKQLQVSQRVPNQYMITAVEYVTPTSATKSSFSGKLQTAIGVTAIGVIVLLVAVSIAQGREEQKKKSHGQEGSAYRGGRGEPAETASFPRDERPPVPRVDLRPPMRRGESNPVAPVRRPGAQPTGGGNTHRNQLG